MSLAKVMRNSIQSVSLDKLIAHPGNPNRQSSTNFAKLVRNIERTSRYEPLVVRPHPERESYFQIINGHHRYKALTKLGYSEADVIIWDVDDEQTDILLATLNRLCGSDQLGKKVELLKRLSRKAEAGELSKVLVQTKKQIQRLVNLKLPTAPAKVDANSFLNPMVFFVTDAQKRHIENALALVEEPNGGTAAEKRTAALVHIAGHFLNHSKLNRGNLD